MSRQAYRGIAFGIIALSICSAIFLAVNLGGVIHFGQQTVSAMSGGPAPTAGAPTSAGWISIVLALVGTFAGPSWAKFFAALGDAVPVISAVAGQFQPLQTFTSRLKGSPLGSLLPLLESIDVTAGNAVTSTGSHPVPGGSVDWKISFTPTPPATLPQ